MVKQAGMVISFAQAAQRIGPRASDRVLASVAQQEAHGHALAGDERAATVALARAYDMVTGAPPPDDRIRLAAHCDVGYLHAQRGSCMVRLPRAAVDAFDEALSCWPSDYRRERGLYPGSARTLDELRDLDAALARVGTVDAEVDAFRHELAAIA